MMSKMGWREIRREAPPARLRHQERVEARNPIMPLVIRQARKKRANRPIGKALFDDRLADLQRGHAGALQLGCDSAKVAEAAVERERF
jgi:hypothetical protein